MVVSSPLMPSTKAGIFTNRFVLIVMISTLARVLFAFLTWEHNGTAVFFKADSGSYLAPASSLLHGSFLSSGYYSALGTPEIFRTPGYSILLAPGLLLKNVILCALFENFVFAFLIIWLISKTTQLLAPSSSAPFWAVLAYVLDPLSFIYSEAIMSETAFTALLLLFVFVVVLFFRRPAHWKLALAAFVLGCATYVRPVPLYLGAILTPLFVLIPRSLDLRRRITGAVLFISVFTLSLMPWIVRNRVVAGYDSFTSSGDWNLYFKAASHTQAKLDHRNAVQTELSWGAGANIEDYFRVHPEQRSWTPAAIALYWRSKGREMIVSHLATYAGIHIRGCLKVLFNPGISDILQSTGSWNSDPFSLSSKLDEGVIPATLWLVKTHPAALIFPLMILQLIVYYLLAALGFRRIAWQPRLFMAIVFAYTVLISGHPGMMARYRVPLMPLVSIAAGIAISAHRQAPLYRSSATAVHGQMQLK